MYLPPFADASLSGSSVRYLPIVCNLVYEICALRCFCCRSILQPDAEDGWQQRGLCDCDVCLCHDPNPNPNPNAKGRLKKSLWGHSFILIRLTGLTPTGLSCRPQKKELCSGADLRRKHGRKNYVHEPTSEGRIMFMSRPQRQLLNIILSSEVGS